MKTLSLKSYVIPNIDRLTLISGPCVIESEEGSMKAAERLVEITSNYPVQFIFKSSYDKANRTSIDSFRGPGLEKGLAILKRVKEEFNVPVLTDVHTPEEALEAAFVCDVIQIPAFLCRQTDLIVACAQSGAIVNIKKGQFLAPWDMEAIVHKLESSGCEKMILVDRGTTFGYNNLVSDMRGIPIMKKFGYPVCFDASHSVQLPGGQGNQSGGQREFIPTLSKAAIAAGADVLFLESHLEPEKAMSDKASVYPMDELPKLLDEVCALYQLTKSFECSSVR